jgi:hypothetical protein
MVKCSCCGENLDDEAYIHCAKCNCGTFELIANKHGIIIQCSSCKYIMNNPHKIKTKRVRDL